MSHDVLDVRSNLVLTARERGKVIARRAGHNIWLNLGREYLALLIAYASFTPLKPERDDRIRYMGLGVGGTRQTSPAVANAPPILTAYPGSNGQVDTDPTVVRLERPVRISGSADPYPGQALDVWLGQVQAPADHVTATQVTFRRLFQQVDISYPPFLSVPISEIGLFTGAVSPNTHNNTMVAYDTFDTISKTVAFELEVAWTVRF
ncbi:hypothetical protein LVJ94_34570 [Pendulispora rubella]|uniref:Uncharacterized protein n=1 Tax=Pendulispora rubella TaxID=2741070 RepID=A0ABZ2KXI5_9BACT